MGRTFEIIWNWLPERAKLVASVSLLTLVALPIISISYSLWKTAHSFGEAVLNVDELRFFDKVTFVKKDKLPAEPAA